MRNILFKHRSDLFFLNDLWLKRTFDYINDYFGIKFVDINEKKNGKQIIFNINYGVI